MHVFVHLHFNVVIACMSMQKIKLTAIIDNQLLLRDLYHKNVSPFLQKCSYMHKLADLQILLVNDNILRQLIIIPHPKPTLEKKRAVHCNHNVKLLGEGVSQGTEICMFETKCLSLSIATLFLYTF